MVYIFFLILGLIIGFIGCLLLKNELLYKKEISLDKVNRIYSATDTLLDMLENGDLLSNRLMRYEAKSVAVYGMGRLGMHLVRELQNQNVKVLYAIDRRKVKCRNIDVYTPKNNLPKVDLIIVSAMVNINEIKKVIKPDVYRKMISINDIFSE